MAAGVADPDRAADADAAGRAGRCCSCSSSLFLVASDAALGAGRLLLLATFSLMLGAGIPLLFFQVRANRMRKKMQDQFPVALDVFVRGLRAGHPIAAALDLLTVEMPDPIGSQFGIVVDEVTYGADLRDALTAMADRWDLETCACSSSACRCRAKPAAIWPRSSKI